MSRIFVLLLVLSVCIPGTTFAFSCLDLSSHTERAMSDWWVPGLAVGVIADGKPVFRQTFGVRDTETGASVTAKTLFGVGSVAKSMTALAFSISDAANELPLDTPIGTVLPFFPKEITIRHLLSHTAGWPRHDALWYLDAYDGHTLSRKLAMLPRFAVPGKSFQYNNVPFAAVGAFLSGFSGVPWGSWIKATVMNPAGMTDAVTELSVFRNSEERALGYYPGDEGRIPIPLRDTDPVAPAGGVYAHLNDMLRYVEMLATGGQRDGRQVVPAAAIDRLWQPTTRRYGLGMRVGSWHSEKLAYHPGAIDGYAARISILPERRAGVVVLSNMSGETHVAKIVSQIALDCLVGVSPDDWLARIGPRPPAPEAKPAPPQPVDIDRELETYSGVYTHPSYGSFRFDASSEGQTLAATFHANEIVLDYAGDETWRLRETKWPLRAGLLFRFDNLEGGKFMSVAIPLADGPTYRHNAGPLIFTRAILR